MPDLILYIILGAVAGILYGMRRIYILENRIIALDSKISQMITRKATSKRKR